MSLLSFHLKSPRNSWWLELAADRSIKQIRDQFCNFSIRLAQGLHTRSHHRSVVSFTNKAQIWTISRCAIMWRPDCPHFFPPTKLCSCGLVWQLPLSDSTPRFFSAGVKVGMSKRERKEGKNREAKRNSRLLLPQTYGRLVGISLGIPAQTELSGSKELQ